MLSAICCSALGLPSVETTRRPPRRAASMQSGLDPQPSSKTSFPTLAPPSAQFCGNPPSSRRKPHTALLDPLVLQRPALKDEVTVERSPLRDLEEAAKCVARVGAASHSMSPVWATVCLCSRLRLRTTKLPAPGTSKRSLTCTHPPLD